MGLEELPSTYNELRETLEDVVLTEILSSNSQYYLNKISGSFMFELNGYLLVIPLPASEYSPPFIRVLQNKILESIGNCLDNLDNFEKEMKEANIKVSKRGGGKTRYTMLSRSFPSESAFWEFNFDEHKKIKDFFVICTKYGLN